MVQQQIFVMFCIGKRGLDSRQFGHRFTSSLYVFLILSVLDKIGYTSDCCVREYLFFLYQNIERSYSYIGIRYFLILFMDSSISLLNYMLLNLYQIITFYAVILIPNFQFDFELTGNKSLLIVYCKFVFYKEKDKNLNETTYLLLLYLGYYT